MVGKGRAPCCDKTKVNRGPWSPSEDFKLISYIYKHGHSNWRALPKQAGLLRCGKSCRLRWINYLKPDVKRGNFSREEEETIIRLQKSLGNKWSMIASKLPGRTDNEIKNVWNTYLKKKMVGNDQEHPSKDSPSSSSCISYSDLINSEKHPAIQQALASSIADGVTNNDPNNIASDVIQGGPANIAEVLAPMQEITEAGEEILLDYDDVDIWAMLDSFDPIIQPDDILPQEEPKVVEKSTDFGGVGDEELLVMKSSDNYATFNFPIWPFSPQDFGI